MTDHVVKENDRVFVFGITSMFEYRFNRDNKGNEQLQLHKVWQADYADNKLRDRVHTDMQKKSKRP